MHVTSSNCTYNPINQGLTQTLSDGATAYVYGAGRVAQINGGVEYFLGDALGSVRQLVDGAGAVSLAQSFDPYGQTQSQAGDGASSYAFTGEYSANGLVYLRARHYAPSMGRFLTRDTWAGDANRPQSLNRWAYVEGNPVRFTDPSGKTPIFGKSGNEVVAYSVNKIREDSMSEAIKDIRELNSTHYYKDACNLLTRMSWWEKVSIGSSRFLTEAAYADSGARASASAWFGCLVADALARPVCGQWDYKKEIRDDWGVAQTVDFSDIGIDEEVIFYYDIWANIHFGYLGLTGGFTEEALLTGAAIEHAASNLETKIQDDPSDAVANLIGFLMYKFNTLSETTLLWWLYIEQSKLNKAVVDEFGNVIRIYR